MKNRHLIKHRKLVWSILSILLIWIACNNLPKFSADFLPAADFEEQASTMVCWNKSYEQILLPLIRIITQHDHVTIFYNTNKKSDIEITLLNHRANIENITLIPFKLEKDNVWIRDFGPNFTHDNREQEAIIGFQYPHLEFKDYNDFTE